MQLELTTHEVALLLRHLDRHLQHLRTDLDPGDTSPVQHALQAEIDALHAIRERLAVDPQETLPDVV
jgi:hypothetical protein